jgi:hypothetical protein
MDLTDNGNPIADDARRQPFAPSLPWFSSSWHPQLCFPLGTNDYSPYTLVPFQLRLVPCHLLKAIYITCHHLEPTHSGATTRCNGGVVGTHISHGNTPDAQAKPEY